MIDELEPTEHKNVQTKPKMKQLKQVPDVVISETSVQENDFEEDY